MTAPLFPDLRLQTVAALLRMQSRRMASLRASRASSVFMRRVSTIALVHESLLQGSGR